MTEKEIAEIRRQLNQEKNRVTNISGCYVNDKGEVISMFTTPFVSLSQEEGEKYLGLFKKTLSGTAGKNLVDVSFDNNQVLNGEEHKLLTSLKNSELNDEGAVQIFFQHIRESVEMEGNYLILLMHNTYEVPYHAKDGQKLEDVQSQIFSHIICSICPVKMTKPALSYDPAENGFHSRIMDWIVTSPVLGFLFPTFDERKTNIYHALYYTKNTALTQEKLVGALFESELPMPAEEQKDTFQAILGDTLGEECSFDLVQNVHEQLCEMIEEHKANKVEEPLVLSKNDVKTLLHSAGATEEHLDEFVSQYDEAFGATTELSPRNLIDPKKLEVKMPDVVIKVNPQRPDLVETRMIDGLKYIMIRVDEQVEVNGVNVKINEAKDLPVEE